MEQNITKLKNKIAIFLDSKIYGIHDLKEKDLLELVMSVDADARKEPPKTHISQLANSKEDCRSIAKMLGCSLKNEFVDIEDVKFTICMYDEEGATRELQISHTGYLWYSEADLGVPNCLQICAFILSKYSL